MLGVASPLLAGRAVDAIVEGRDTGVVVGIAVLIAVVAVVDAAVGLLERLESSRLGEGLILDLRRRVFEHVQSMPIAFFTRTHTGALVSRLNNDVIGAQRAFTSALSGVVTNVIALVLTLGRDAQPVVADHRAGAGPAPAVRDPRPPDRFAGSAGSSGRRPEHNAAMTSQMTERFSAPGATLVKLFGRPGRGGRRVRGPGRAGAATSASASAMAMEVFFRSLDARVRAGRRARSTASAATSPCVAGSTPAPSSRWPCC